jgi:hypothetical protein
MTSTVPASISAEMGGALSPTQAAVVSAQMRAEMGGALDAEARTARMGQYLSPAGERAAVAPANLAAEAGGALGYPQGRFVSPTGELTPGMPANIRAEMGGALNTPQARFASPTGGMTAEIPASIRAEMGGALSREMPSPPPVAPVAPVTQAPMAAEAAVAAPREVPPQRAPESAPVAAPGTQLTAGERAQAGTLTEEELGGLLRKASSNEIGSTKAKEELASLIGQNPQLKDAFGRLGIESVVDCFTSNVDVLSFFAFAITQ